MEHPKPIARELPTAEVAAFLRSLVGLPPSEHEGAEITGRAAPTAVDATAWIGWALAGLYACALPSGLAEDEDEDALRNRGPWVPSIRGMVKEARRTAVVVAMHRHDGNLSRAAKALGTSRRSLRETLRAAGLYPWGGVAEGDEASDDEASNEHDAVSVDVGCVGTDAGSSIDDGERPAIVVTADATILATCEG